MNLNKLKFLFLDGVFFAAKYWYLILAAAVLLFVVWGVRSCQSWQTKRKIERIESNIERGKTNAIESEAAANIYSNLANNQKEVIKNAENKTNISRNTVNRAFERDSNSFSGNYREAKRKYCAENPNDSVCR